MLPWVSCRESEWSGKEARKAVLRVTASAGGGIAWARGRLSSTAERRCDTSWLTSAGGAMFAWAAAWWLARFLDPTHFPPQKLATWQGLRLPPFRSQSRVELRVIGSCAAPAPPGAPFSRNRSRATAQIDIFGPAAKGPSGRPSGPDMAVRVPSRARDA